MSLYGWESVNRNSSDYKLCVTAATVTNAVVEGATGSVAPGSGNLTRCKSIALWGFTAGYLVSPHIAPALGQKMQAGLDLDYAEVDSAAEAMGLYAGVSKAADAIRLLGMIRPISSGQLLVPACTSPRLTAMQLLAVSAGCGYSRDSRYGRL